MSDGIELYPGIWVKGCGAFLEIAPSTFAEKVWSKFGYKKKVVYQITQDIPGCPTKINEILKTGEVDKEEYSMVNGKFTSNESQETNRKNPWTKTLSLDEEGNPKMVINH